MMMIIIIIYSALFYVITRYTADIKTQVRADNQRTQFTHTAVSPYIKIHKCSSLSLHKDT